jgi:tRNA (cytidine/uridine-2'-O-)-methyltransferase
MLNLVLFEPEIPNNTGSLIRLSANMGVSLHLIKPFGFEITDKRLRRAGLDYKELAQVFEYENFDHYLDKAKPERLFAVSSKVQTNYAEVEYQEGESLSCRYCRCCANNAGLMLVDLGVESEK